MKVKITGKGISKLPEIFQKETGGESNTMKIIITGKDLTKAQYQNSQIGKPLTFPTFQQSVNQIMTGACQDGYQKNPITGQCEPKPNFGVPSSPQIRTNLGKGFIRNPETGMYSKPAEPNYGEGIYKGKPSKKGVRSFATGLNNLFTAAEIASNLYSNRINKRDENRAAHFESLPDLNQVVPGSDYGMWTTNQNRQDPRKQYTVNIGQSTNQFEPVMAYGEDGMQVPTIPGDYRVQESFIPNINPIPQTIMAFAQPAVPTDVSAITGDPSMMSSSKTGTSGNSSSFISSGDYALPVANFKITSGFGNRKAPIKGASTNHNGLDLAVPENTNVFSPMDGVVEKVYYNDKGGKQLIIRHPDGSKSGFAHLNNYNVSVGDSVKKGQVVALSGNTGNSSGPHLHFTWHTPDGTTVDPRTIFNFDVGKPSGTKKSSGNQLSYSHNNPLNVHYGKFASGYGATLGSPDAGTSGNIAMFPDLETGIRANKDLLFGPNYINLTVSEARNRWVKGNKNKYSSSTEPIVNEMGTNKRLADLTPAERDKLFKLFAKWEGRQAYNLIKDRRIFDDGGEINSNNMKIIITGTPTKSMAYGGQLGYGFDLGQRNTYSAMKKNPYENTSKTLQPVPREEANIEAEKGETAYGDLDGDGQNEHMKIGGERHVNGGTPLNVKPGSFIFSDTAKMRIKDPEVLRFFGLSPKKGGYTPAEIAKRYDINKYKGILQDPYADSIQKNTAQKMIDNYEQKLGYLALIQESMKGFPQGIPEVAENIMGGSMGQQPGGPEPNGVQEYPEGEEPNEGQPEEQAQEQGMEEEPEMRWGGGLQRFQVGRTVPGSKTFRVGDKDVTARYFPYGQQPPAGYNPYPNIPNLYERPGVAGTPGSISIVPARGGRRGNEEAYWRNFLIPKLQSGVTPEDLVKNRYMHSNAIERARQYYKPIPGKDAIPPDYVYTEQPKTPEEEEGTTTTTTTPPGTTTTTTTPPDIPTTDITTKGNQIPYGWDLRDKINALNALSNYTGVKKDLFDYQKIKPVLPQIAMEDWLSKVQSRWQGYNQVANQIAQMMPGQSAISNLSFSAGQPAEGASQDISQTNLNNIKTFIDNEREKANILNNAIAYNAGVTDKNRELRFNVNRQYGTDKRLAKNAFVQAYNQGITNATDRYNLNQVESPYYYIHPLTGQIVFNSLAAKQEFEKMRKMGYKGSTDYAAQQAQTALAIYKNFYDNAPGTDEEKAKAAIEAMKVLSPRAQAIPATPTYRHGGQHNLPFGYTYNNPFLM